MTSDGLRLFAIMTLVLWVGGLADTGGVAAQTEAAVERLLSQAEQKAREGDLAGALRDYSTLVDQFPASPASVEALLRLALGHRELGEEDEAEAAARRLLESFARAPQAAGAYVVLGEIRLARARRPESLDEARATFANAALLFDRQSYRDLEWRAVGAVRSGEIALLQGELEEASRVFVEVLDHEPPSTWTDRARLGLSDSLLAKGLWRQAAEILVDEERTGLEPGAAALARRQGLVERIWLRPAAGGSRWRRAASFGPAGSAWKKPWGLAAREDGRLLLTDLGEQSTVSLTAGGERVARWAHAEPARPSWGESGEVIVAARQGAYVEPGRGRLGFAAAPGDKGGDLLNVEAVEPAAFGDWFVLTHKPARVMVYDRKLDYMRKLLGAPEVEPVDIARDSRGRLYVLDRKSGAVHRFSADGRPEERLEAGDWRKPAGLDLDAAGNLYVLDRDSRQISVLDPAGQRLESLGPTLPGGVELKRPLDLAVDGEGRVFVLESRPAGIVVVE